MRFLQKNTQPIWYANVLRYDEVKDEDGFFTGEIVPVYDTPNKTNVCVYPATGAVLERTFGLTGNIDLVAVGAHNLFAKDTVIYITEPISPYTDYDYTISKILPSLNHTNYGLKART